MRQGQDGEVYNFGGSYEVSNLDLTHTLLDLLNKPRSLIKFVTDRPGHDHRYAIDFTKATNELGWTPEISFRDGLRETIDWYLQQTSWIENIRSGAYQTYYETQYAARLGE
jgi:dTDP-glucose 4,6-dehydratase